MPTIIPRGNGLAVVAPSEPTTLSQAGKSARERAIAKLQGTSITVEAKETKTLEPAKQESQVAETTLESAIEAAQEVHKNTTESVEAASEEPATSEETKVDASKEASKDPLSSQYAVLARKEKALRAKVQEQNAAMQAKEAALKAREDALSAKDNQYKQGFVSKEDFAKNPWKYLAESGITYDQLTEMALNQSKADPAVTAKLEALEAQLKSEREERLKYEESFKKNQEEQQSAAYKQAVETIRRDASTLVKSNAEQYEMIASTESVNDIVDLIEQTWKEDQVLMTVEEAAAEVEKYLEEEALKLARLKKVQNKLQTPGAKTVTFKESEANQAKQPQMKTLTNAIGAQKPISARERAILAMRGELKK